MIKSFQMLVHEYSHYQYPSDKVLRMVKDGKYFKITKGLYETNQNTPGYLVANAIYGPSYLSFEFALSYHGLIPEAVYTYTCATYKKKKEKTYVNSFGTFTFKDVPSTAFPYEILIIKEGDYIYHIASAEKSLCDKLYSIKPVKNKKEMKFLLFHELRIDEEKFDELDKELILQLCELYPSTNLKILKKIINIKRTKNIDGTKKTIS